MKYIFWSPFPDIICDHVSENSSDTLSISKDASVTVHKGKIFRILQLAATNWAFILRINTYCN